MQLPISSFLHTVFRPVYSLHLRSITKKNLPFFIGWICIFIWLYAYFLPMGGFKLESELYNRNAGSNEKYFYVWLLTGCLIPMLFSGRKFVPKTFYSVLGAIFCFFVLRFTGPGVLSQCIMIFASACIGHIFASNVYAFFMVLNNAEKFYSMILAVLFPKIFMLIKPVFAKLPPAFDVPSLIILVIIMILAVCSYLFRSRAEQMSQPEKIKAPTRAYALMPLIFVVLAVNDVIAPASLKQITAYTKSQIESYYFVGILIGIAAVVVMQKRLAINICNMLNISFALLAIGFVLDIISFQTAGTGPATAVCFGISYAIGLINIYYLSGFMTKKFQSIPFYKVGILFASLYYFASFTVMNLYQEKKILSPTFMALICICIVIIFFMLTPFFVKMLYEGEWIEDSYRQDVTRCSRLEAKLRDYKLTSAEIEVCKLLLEGCTLRQISGIQSKAYATINTYCTSIYRKLKINSRTELLILLQNYNEK